MKAKTRRKAFGIALVASTFLGTSCGDDATPEKIDPKVNSAVARVMMDRFKTDYKNIPDSGKFAFQLMDDETYKDPNDHRWHVGSNCLKKQYAGSSPIIDGNILRIIDTRTGTNPDLVFEIGPTRLVPGGEPLERTATLGVLATNKCLFGARQVDTLGGNTILWPTDTTGMQYTALAN